MFLVSTTVPVKTGNITVTFSEVAGVRDPQEGEVGSVSDTRLSDDVMRRFPVIRTTVATVEGTPSYSRSISSRQSSMLQGNSDCTP